jgi:hypothetical protein
MSFGPLISLAALLSTASLAAQAGAARPSAAPPRDRRAELPLVVTAVRIETGPPWPAGRGVPRVEVRNAGQVAILACGVKFTLTLPDGTTKPEGFMIDAAHTAPAARKWLLPPGGHATLPSGTGVLVSPEAVGGDARATFVVFEDDTAVGDEQEIARIFSARRDRHVFWDEMDAIFTDVTARDNDALGVFALLRTRMESETDPAFRRGAGGWYDEILARMTERRMTLTKTTPQFVFDSIRTAIADHKTLCDTHLQRRR